MDGVKRDLSAVRPPARMQVAAAVDIAVGLWDVKVANVLHGVVGEAHHLPAKWTRKLFCTRVI